MEAVLLCHNARLGQVVLDTLHANGVKPWLVVDPTTASSLRSSRLIRGTLLAKPDLAAHAQTIADLIYSLNRAPDVVLAADVEGLLILSALRDQLGGLRFPQPEHETLTLLNNKWTFRNLCNELGLPTPKSMYYAAKTNIDPGVIAREVGFPVVLKPAAKFSSVGLRMVASEDAMRRIMQDTRYQFDSLIVQQFIIGNDIGGSLFARDGKVIAATTFDCGENDATVFHSMPEFAAMMSRIIQATRYTGVANFDARVDVEGHIHLFECNPRFFMRLSAVRICGLDLLRLGLLTATGVNGEAQGSYYAKSDILTWNGVCRVLSGEWRTRILLQSWREACHDPWPLMRRRAGTDPLRR
jgi:predicted ATP-grasp superfamily ATP-dependent carboligase